MIYSSFHMTQDVAIAILPRIGKIGVPRHFFISTTDLSDRTDKCPVGGWEQDKNQINPLERMEGVALLSCFRLGLIRASS